MAFFKTVLRFNQQNLGSAVNVFFNRMDPVFTDAQLLTSLTAWMTAVYGPLRNFMDAGCVLASGQVLEVNGLGETLRVVGSIAPVVSGINAGEQLALPTAMSATGRTGVAAVRGGKRFPGLAEVGLIDGLLTNQALAALAQATGFWLNGPTPPLGSGGASAGVISTKALTYVPFAGTGLVSNIPGTQVTRKPGRGS